MIVPVKIVLSLIASYLIGSIPTAYLFGKIYKGIDIRQFGSGNVGATNAFRVLGKIPGIIVLIVDMAKGLVATTLVADLSGLQGNIYYVVLGLTVVAGHNWTIFLRFKGGKGIATSLGVLIGLTIKIVSIRPVLGLSVFIWLAVFLSTGFVSLASVMASFLLPILMVVFSQSFEVTALGVILCIFVVFRHKTNIKRLLSGEEPRVNLPFKKKS